MSCAEIFAVCSEIHTKYSNTLCGENMKTSNVKPSGIRNNHWALKGSLTRIRRYPLDKGGRNSSVGIATRYGVDGPGIESRWGAKFSAPVQIDPGAHPVSCTMVNVSLSRG